MMLWSPPGLTSSKASDESDAARVICTKRWHGFLGLATFIGDFGLEFTAKTPSRRKERYESMARPQLATKFVALFASAWRLRGEFLEPIGHQR
jgi:hypothetical protein